MRHEEARRLPAAMLTGAGQGAALPAVWLTSEGARWAAERDLLATPPFGRRFTVEMEDDGRARLRFGDGVNGRRPGPDQAFEARYRVGNGPAGNLGAEKLGVLVPAIEGASVRNPLAAAGGEAPEPLERARLDAPEAFRVQQRAVTEADYTEAAERHPEVGARSRDAALDRGAGTRCSSPSTAWAAPRSTRTSRPESAPTWSASGWPATTSRWTRPASSRSISP